MQKLLIVLGFILTASLPFLAGHLHANQLNDETGSQKKFKPRDSAPYRNLASILKTAHIKASSAKVSNLQKRKKSSATGINKLKKIAADKKKRSLNSVSRQKASSGRIITGKSGEHRKLTHRVSRHSGKTVRNKHSYSTKYSAKSKNLRNGLNRKKAGTPTKSASR
jgi:hypothetical protein